MTRRQKVAHLARLRGDSPPRSLWPQALGKFVLLTVVLFVIRIGLGALVGNPQFDVGTMIWAPALAAVLVALDVYRTRKRSH